MGNCVRVRIEGDEDGRATHWVDPLQAQMESFQHLKEKEEELYLRPSM